MTQIKKSELIEIFDTYISNDGKLKATVWYDSSHGIWGCSFYVDEVWQQDQWFPDHSERYAEDAAENFVMGILKLS